MDAAGEVAQLAQRVLGPDPRLGEQFAGTLRVLGELLLGHPEAHAERDEPSLRTVVQVAFDPAQLGLLGVHRSGARGLERLDPLGHLGPARRAQQGGSELGGEDDRDGQDRPHRPEVPRGR